MEHILVSYLITMNMDNTNMCPIDDDSTYNFPGSQDLN